MANCRVFRGILVALLNHLALSVSCGALPCGSGGSSCATYPVVLGGVMSTQTFWVNDSSGKVYLPLSATTKQPFPSISQVFAGQMSAPNAVVIVGSSRLLIAWSCVLVQYDNSTGDVHIVRDDDTFAITRDETQGVYRSGAGGYLYGRSRGCTNSSTAEQLLSGADSAMGYANINLSGTVFSFLESSAVCDSAADSCICKYNWTSGTGPFICPGAWLFYGNAGAGAIRYFPSLQSIELLVNSRSCAEWFQWYDFDSILLDVVTPMPATSTQTGSMLSSSAASSSKTSTSTPSTTRSQSVFESQAPSTSLTSTPSMSLSISQTPTGSSTSTPSMSLSISQTPSGSAILTQSQSSSQAYTDSASPTSSQTWSSVMLSAISSSNRTGSTTLSPTTSASSTITLSQSNRSSGLSPTPSLAPTSSQTSSTRSSLQWSQSPSASASPRTSSALRASGSASMFQSTTPTLSVTPSPQPFALIVSSSDSDHDALPSAGVFVSDSSPTAVVRLWLDRCPTASDLASSSITCVATAAAPVVLFTAVGFSAGRVSVAAGATLATPCESSLHSPALLAQSAWVGASFSVAAVPAGFAELACSVSNSVTGQVLASITAPLEVIPTRWPLWDDAISINSIGVMRSARLGRAVNATAALLNAATHLAAGLTLESALASPAAVLLAAQLMWSNLTYAPSSAGFTLTLVGASRVVLRAAAGSSAFSFDTTNASVGGIPAPLSAVSVDGVWAVIDTPSASRLCGGDSIECGYATLLLANSGTPMLRGAALQCPPFCPGAVGGGAIPFALGDGSFALGTAPLSPLGSLPARRSTASAITSEGIYYTVRCAQTGLWTDPASGACANESDPTSLACALGSGDSCRACPAGGLCPGGSHLWARAGFWAPSESATSVTPCAPPNAVSRCPGWSASHGSTSCGPAYLQGSFRCSACASGYFIDESGTCVECPSVESAWQRYDTLVILFIALVCIAASLYALLSVIVCIVGGTISGGVYRMYNLVMWALTCAQVVSDAAAVVSPSLPPLVAALYNAAAVIQLQGVLRPPACTGAPPFETEFSMMGASLIMFSIAVAAYYMTTNAKTRIVGQVALMVAMILYPGTVLTATRLMYCTPVTLTAQGAAGLDGGPPFDARGAVSARDIAHVSLHVSASNPYFVCWTGHHLTAGSLAIVTLVLYSAGLPCLTLWWLWKDPRMRFDLARASAAANPAGMSSSFSSPGANYAAPRSMSRDTYITTGDEDAETDGKTPSMPCSPAPDPDALLGVFLSDFKASAWFSKHLDLGLLALLSVFRALLPHPDDLAGIAAKSGVLCAVLLVACVHVMWTRPYVEAWMNWVRALLLVDSIAITLLNAIVCAHDAGFRGLADAIVLGGYTVVALCVATLAVLVIGCCWYAYKGAGQEALIFVLEAAGADVDELREEGRRARTSSGGTTASRAQPQGPPTPPPSRGADHEAVHAALSSSTPHITLASGALLYAADRRVVTGPLRAAAGSVVSTPEHLAIVATLTAEGATPISVCGTCARVRSLLKMHKTMAEHRQPGRVAAVAGLLAAGIIPALAALLSGPLAVDDSVALAGCVAAAAVVSAAKESVGAVLTPRLDSAGLVALATALAGVLSRHRTASTDSLLALCLAIGGVAEVSEAGVGAFSVAGGIAHLADALSSRINASSLHAATAACAALEAVTAYRRPAAIAAAAGVLGPVLALIAVLKSQPPNQPTACRALAVAAGVVANVGVDERAAERFVATGGAAVLIGAALTRLGVRGGADGDMKSTPEAAVEATCRAIYSLKSYSRGRSTLAAAGAIELLRRALDAYPDNASVSDSADWALQALLAPERRLSVSAVVPIVR